MDGRPPPVSLMMVTVYRCIVAGTLACCGVGVVVSVGCWCCGRVFGVAVVLVVL